MRAFFYMLHREGWMRTPDGFDRRFTAWASAASQSPRSCQHPWCLHGGCAALTHPTNSHLNHRLWWVRCAYPPYKSPIFPQRRRAGKRRAPAAAGSGLHPITNCVAKRTTLNRTIRKGKNLLDPFRSTPYSSAPLPPAVSGNKTIW